MTSPIATLPAAPAAASAHILVVDDVEKNTRLLADLLGASGYRTSKASSGAQALELIEGSAPDLVLLDVMMPGMSGYEVCRTLRADPRHALLPVVLVTALDPATERANGLDAGADDFINKPINQAELLARVRSLLRVKTLQDQLLRQRAGPHVPQGIARRGEMVALCVTWPGLFDAVAASEPDALFTRVETLQDQLVQRALRHEGTVADCGAQGMTVLFGDPATPPEAVRRARHLAADLQALKMGLSLGLAQGTATVGALNLPGGGHQWAALGPVVQLAQRLAREAAADELRVSDAMVERPHT